MREPGSYRPYVARHVAEIGKAASGLEYARTQRSKKSGGASERGPSQEGERRASVSDRSKRKDARWAGLGRSEAAGNRPRPRMTWERHPAARWSPERTLTSRGTGTVMVAAPRKGPFPAEGSSGHLLPLSFTRGRSRGLGDFLTRRSRSAVGRRRKCVSGRAKAVPSSTREEMATGESAARLPSGTVGRQRPRSQPMPRSGSRGREAQTARVRMGSAKAVHGVVKHLNPRPSCTEPRVRVTSTRR